MAISLRLNGWREGGAHAGSANTTKACCKHDKADDPASLKVDIGS